MKAAYRIIEVGLTRWQWQVLKASARAWRHRDVEALAAELLYQAIYEESTDPRAEFEEPFEVPKLPWWRWESQCGIVIYPAHRKGSGQAPEAYRWHPRRWWKGGKR
jgi:hypothetical protein